MGERSDEINDVIVNLIDFLLVLQRHGGGERKDDLRKVVWRGERYVIWHGLKSFLMSKLVNIP